MRSGSKRGRECVKGCGRPAKVVKVEEAGGRSSVQVFGTELVWREQGGRVELSSSTVIRLLTSELGLHETEEVWQQEQGGSSKEFVSWPALRSLLSGGLQDLALRHLLGSQKCDQGAPQGDHTTLRGIQVQFKVRGGQVYLEVLSAFTAIDRLDEVMKGDWSKVDNELTSHGISQKQAFKKRGTGTGRSYITLEALKVVSDGCEAAPEVDSLVVSVATLLSKKEALCAELQQTIAMIRRQGHIAPKAKQEAWRVQATCSNLLCSRGHHLVLQCCHSRHYINIANTQVGFVRKAGKIFLEMCAAFGVLGRMYVVRESDYRKPDKAIQNHFAREGTESVVEQHYLFEEDDSNVGRNKRTHVGLEAFIVLANSDFIDEARKDNLSESIFKLTNANLNDVKKCISKPENLPNELSDSDVEDKFDLENHEDSSGFDSEANSSESGFECLSTVVILGKHIPLKIVKGKPFLGKVSIIRLIESPSPLPSLKGHKVFDRLVESCGMSVEESIIYEGRQRSYISVSALKTLLHSEPLQNITEHKKFVEEVEKLEDGSYQDISMLQINEKDTIRYKVVSDVVYIDSMKLLQLSGHIAQNYASNKANLILCRILGDQGVDLSHCFLRQGKSKYGLISFAAATIFLRLNIKDSSKSKMINLLEGIENALRVKNLLFPPGPSLFGSNTIDMGEEFPSIRFRIQSGHLYLHRRVCFDQIGLENAINASKKSYGAVNSILLNGGVDLSLAYVSSKQQRYSFISAFSLLYLLGCKDPLMVCLPQKDKFLLSLLSALQTGAVSSLSESESYVWLVGKKKESLEIKAKNGRIYVLAESAYSLSGLLMKTEGNLKEQVEMFSERNVGASPFIDGEAEDWLSLECLLLLLSQAGCGEGGGGGESFHSVAWRDLLSAVAIQEPLLRVHIQMETFKKDLYQQLLQLYVQGLPNSSDLGFKDTTDESGVETDSNEVNSAPLCHSDYDNSSASDAGIALSDNDEANGQDDVVANESEDEWNGEYVVLPFLTAERYNELLEDVVESTDGVGGTVGDWELLRADHILKLVVKPGYGASKKLSFLQPDYAAILQYELTLGEGRGTMSINNMSIPQDVFKKLMFRSEREGTLSLLYQLISLRPCFGCFDPELVETVKQWSCEQQESQGLGVDGSFVGSRSTGRTYAGTVRSTRCLILSDNRVSDRCSACTTLSGLTINRSVLAGSLPGAGGGPGGQGKGSQESVWQVATTSASCCSLVCPQVQTFNTSLPHAFKSCGQANTVVEHSVSIHQPGVGEQRGAQLRVEVALSGRKVAAAFPQFKENRQLGPLLDWVAGLRLCVGYSAQGLVEQAAFITENLSSLRPDLRKLFKFITVDKSFTCTLESGEGSVLVGTIRAASCQVSADQGADICHQCRLLQEPIEFLAV